ncbi:hypothetical protein DERP_011174 [Dermatophagoides pteronyssinus]|uniref:Uncharacterized protein n=1 Tax=Dermatophagoides pteronyssinus TaxID=6956 RepID=A0ABQ8JCD3_DERPT|nr:hypothetical protein DERP_011174 [Dermatophagoides pteronyssinus]
MIVVRLWPPFLHHRQSICRLCRNCRILDYRGLLKQTDNISLLIDAKCTMIVTEGISMQTPILHRNGPCNSPN